jgi:F-type H+-transporting ATPase subunit epsilon
MAETPKELRVSIINPEAVVFEGKVKSLTSQNQKGVFDILPYHSNFVTLIKDKVSLIDKNNVPYEFKVQAGIMKVYDNNIYIFLGIETENMEAGK